MENCNKQLNNSQQQYGAGEYDPDLPNANEMMAAICCVSSQFIVHPSADLAMLVADLAHKLTVPQYAAFKLVTEVAKRLVYQWDEIVREQQANLMDATPLSESLH